MNGMQDVNDHRTLTRSYTQTHSCSSILVRWSVETIYYPAPYANSTHTLSKKTHIHTRVGLHLYCPADHLLSRCVSFLPLVSQLVYVIIAPYTPHDMDRMHRSDNLTGALWSRTRHLWEGPLLYQKPLSEAQLCNRTKGSYDIFSQQHC